MRPRRLAFFGIFLLALSGGCADPSSPYVCQQPSAIGATDNGASMASDGGVGGGGAPGSGSAGGPTNCPAPPAGVDVGFASCNQLGDVVLEDCDGNEYPLTNLCGAKGLWIFAAYGWCSACQIVSSQQEGIQDAHHAQGLRSVNIILQKADHSAADASYCKIWRDKFKLADVISLYDPSGASLALWPGGSTSLSAFVNRDRVIVDKLVQDSNLDNIETGIERALAP